MRKENKFLVSYIGKIAEVEVILDDDNNFYLYTGVGEEYFCKPDEEDNFFDTKQQAEDYVKENIIPFDKDKVKEYLAKRFKVNSISNMKDILPNSLIDDFITSRTTHINDLGWTNCNIVKYALKGIFCIDAITFRKEEVSCIKHGEDDWVEITLKDGTKLTPHDEDENTIIHWGFGGNLSGVHYTNIKKPMATEEE